MGTKVIFMVITLIFWGMNINFGRAQQIHKITVRKNVPIDTSLRPAARILAPSAPRERVKREKTHLLQLYPDSSGEFNYLRNLSRQDINYEIRLITLYKDAPPRYWEKTNPEFLTQELPNVGQGSADSLLWVEYVQITASSRTRKTERSYLVPFAVQTQGRASWQKLKIRDLYLAQKNVRTIPPQHEIVRYKLLLINGKEQTVYQTVCTGDELDVAMIPDFVAKIQITSIEAVKPLPKNKMKERSILLSDLNLDAESLRRR